MNKDYKLVRAYRHQPTEFQSIVGVIQFFLELLAAIRAWSLEESVLNRTAITAMTSLDH